MKHLLIICFLSSILLANQPTRNSLHDQLKKITLEQANISALVHQHVSKNMRTWFRAVYHIIREDEYGLFIDKLLDNERELKTKEIEIREQLFNLEE